jgi:type II secretory pathway pseudopilin PulG
MKSHAEHELSTRKPFARKREEKRTAFTLLQILVVAAIIVLLAGITFGAMQRSRRSAQRATCDMHLKAIALALDAFRQEYGAYPTSLSELVDKKYITDANLLRCPLDPRADGSYEEYYIYRGARPAKDDKRDQSALPLIVCPFHEEDGNVGVQAFRGNTQQFATQPATLAESTGATVLRPGKAPVSARDGMSLHGGDRVQTSGGGSAKIVFTDGSYATLSSDADVTVLESFVAGHNNAPLYTVLRQQLGEVFYRVNHGSKFDVVTPTATAGALGTEFRIKHDHDAWYLRVEESKVLCNTPTGSKIYTAQTSLANQDSGWNLIGTDSSSGSDDDGHHHDEDDDDDDGGHHGSH